MAETTQESVYNHDVAFVNDKLVRFAYEMVKSVSSNLSGVNQFDAARLSQYLDSIDAGLAYIAAQPQLDLPESSPLQWIIESFPVVPNVESDEIDHILRLLKVGRTELINSQSARAGAGLLGFDAARVSAIVAKCRAFLTGYVQTMSPQDLPESSPQEANTGAGLLGVNPQ